MASSRPLSRAPSSRGRAGRKAQGVFYTPPRVASHMIANLLAFSSNRLPHLLDPACGDGVFLCEAFRQLAARNNTPPTPAARLELVQACIYGVDLDAAAVSAARRNLTACILAPCSGVTPRIESRTAAAVALCIAVGDAIVSDSNVSPHAFDWSQLPRRDRARGGFDLIAGNPPYLSIRQIHQTHGAAYAAHLRRSFATASGAYDAYVLFIERAQQLLAAGGYCAMITPARLAEMDYARGCRELLLRNTLHRIDDLSRIAGIFPGASVYPHVYLWQKQPPEPHHQTAVSEVDTLDQLDNGARRAAVYFLPQADLAASGFALSRSAKVLEQAVTTPLGDCGAVLCGAAGFSAQQLAVELVDRAASGAGDSTGDIRSINSSISDDAESGMPFIVSGNIDRYRIAHGNVRFMKRRFGSPVLPYTSSYLNPARRKLYEEPKIVVAGMTRRIEAALCTAPLAIGVQTYAVKPAGFDPWFLLGLLNSRLISYWFASRFAARRLSGGFLAINKSQLEQIPIASATAAAQADIATAARTLSDSIRRSGSAVDIARCERQLDALVYQLYELSDDAVQTVEASCLID